MSTDHHQEVGVGIFIEIGFSARGDFVVVQSNLRGYLESGDKRKIPTDQQ
jgi:hypothetical protein